VDRSVTASVWRAAKDVSAAAQFYKMAADQGDGDALAAYRQLKGRRGARWAKAAHSAKGMNE